MDPYQKYKNNFLVQLLFELPTAQQSEEHSAFSWCSQTTTTHVIEFPDGWLSDPEPEMARVNIIKDTWLFSFTPSAWWRLLTHMVHLRHWKLFSSSSSSPWWWSCCPPAWCSGCTICSASLSSTSTTASLSPSGGRHHRHGHHHHGHHHHYSHYHHHQDDCALERVRHDWS